MLKMRCNSSYLTTATIGHTRTKNTLKSQLKADQDSLSKTNQQSRAKYIIYKAFYLEGVIILSSPSPH